MDTSSYSPSECRCRLEDVIEVLDEIGVPELDSPAQRVRALVDQLTKSVESRDRILGVSIGLKEQLDGANMMAAACWNQYPNVPPPTDRDVLAFRDGDTQVVVRYDPKPEQFYTTCGTRIWINHVTAWRELVEGPQL
jgi:hypothetical protein